MVLSGDIREIKRNYSRDRLVLTTRESERVIADFADSCTVDESGRLVIKLASPDDKQSVMARLISNYDIDEIGVLEPSLNDIFVEYTKEGI